MTPDDELVDRAAAGDEAAITELVERHRDRAYRIALRMLGDHAEAEDVLQEAFLHALDGLATFRREARFSTWLHRITVNAALMRRRAARRRPVESLEALLPRYTGEDRLERLDLDYGRAARADELVERAELARAVREAVDRLPDSCRAAFVLHDLEELSTDEVASVLEVEPSAVRQRLHRARLMMRGFLGRLTGGET